MSSHSGPDGAYRHKRLRPVLHTPTPATPNPLQPKEQTGCFMLAPDPTVTRPPVGVSSAATAVTEGDPPLLPVACTVSNRFSGPVRRRIGPDVVQTITPDPGPGSPARQSRGLGARGAALVGVPGGGAGQFQGTPVDVGMAGQAEGYLVEPTEQTQRGEVATQVRSAAARIAKQGTVALIPRSGCRLQQNSAG